MAAHTAIVVIGREVDLAAVVEQSVAVGELVRLGAVVHEQTLERTCSLNASGRHVRRRVVAARRAAGPAVLRVVLQVRLTLE
jgi:aspartate oxidase